LAVYGDRQTAIANDLTKLYEQVARGTLSSLLAGIQGQTLRGEYIVVIAGQGAQDA
jgi:16S rRNA (cytidine1402-2'-O)-methyltransferase